MNLETFRKIVAPEFASMTDDDLNLFGAEAEIEVSQKVFGDRYPRAVCLIAAHLIAMSKKKSEQAGPLKRTKVNALEREYAVSEKGQDDSYNLTTYGKEFLRLRRQCIMGPKFVSC